MRLWPAILTGLFILLWLVFHPARANGNCELWAGMVEQLESLTAEQRKQQLQTWLEQTIDDVEAQRHIMSAVNWLEADRDAEGALAQCTSI